MWLPMLEVTKGKISPENFYSYIKPIRVPIFNFNIC